MTGQEIPTVSVAMAVFNERPEYLAAAVYSLVEQTFPDWELILVDDGSDAAGARAVDEVIARHCDSRIRLARQSNMGLTKSLNRAFSMARGRYFARLDSDDVAMPNRFEAQVGFLDANPDIGVVGSDFMEIDFSGRPVREVRKETEHELIHVRMLFDNHICHSSVMIRKEAFFSAGGYDESFELAQDYDLWLRLAGEGIFRLASISRFLVQLRRSGTTVSETRRAAQRTAADRARKRHLEGLAARDRTVFSERLLAARLLYPDDALLSSLTGAVDSEEARFAYTLRLVEFWSSARVAGSESFRELFMYLCGQSLQNLAVLACMQGRGPDRANGSAGMTPELVAATDALIARLASGNGLEDELNRGAELFLPLPWKVLTREVAPYGAAAESIGLCLARLLATRQSGKSLFRSCLKAWISASWTSFSGSGDHHSEMARSLPESWARAILSRSVDLGIAETLMAMTALVFHNARAASGAIARRALMIAGSISGN